jgi:hypothetical protein
MSEISEIEARLLQVVDGETMIDGTSALTAVLFSLIKQFPPELQKLSIQFIRKACDDMPIPQVH